MSKCRLQNCLSKLTEQVPGKAVFFFILLILLKKKKKKSLPIVKSLARPKGVADTGMTNVERIFMLL